LYFNEIVGHAKEAPSMIAGLTKDLSRNNISSL
jgi:hypothetical protein